LRSTTTMLRSVAPRLVTWVPGRRGGSRNVKMVTRNMASENQKRGRVDLPGLRQTLDHLGCRSRLPSFEARHVTLGHLQFARESFQRPTARLTLRPENGSKLRRRRIGANVCEGFLSVLGVLHIRENSAVYRISQQPSASAHPRGHYRAPSGWSANNLLQRTRWSGHFFPTTALGAPLNRNVDFTEQSGRQTRSKQRQVRTHLLARSTFEGGA